MFSNKLSHVVWNCKYHIGKGNENPKIAENDRSEMVEYVRHRGYRSRRPRKKLADDDAPKTAQMHDR